MVCDVASPRPGWERGATTIIASGPSLTLSDVQYAFYRSEHVIVINSSWRICPQADLLYGADRAWWADPRTAPAADEFAGERWTCSIGFGTPPNWAEGEPQKRGIKCIDAISDQRLVSLNSALIATGSNSSFQAMNLAVLFGSRKIVFLGLDLSSNEAGETHHHNYPPEFVRTTAVGYESMMRAFNAAAPQLERIGVEVINASRRSALRCFPRMAIEDAIR